MVSGSPAKEKYDLQKLLTSLLQPEPGLSVHKKLLWVRTNDDRLMDWVQNQLKPVVLAGFELEICYQRLKAEVEKLPRRRAIPPQTDPESPVFRHKKRPEAGLDLASPKLRVKSLQRTTANRGVVEDAVNKFLSTDKDLLRCSFHAKQRFADAKALVSSYNGKALTEAVIKMPERESEETYVPPEPAFAGIPLHAFAGENAIFKNLTAPVSLKQNEKSPFLTKFYLPDLRTTKAIIAQNQRSEGADPYKPVSDHKFRSEDKPAEYGKPDFKLRLKSEPPQQLLMFDSTESDVQRKARNREAIRRREEEERMRRTVIGGSLRAEWAIAKQTAPKALQLASGVQHQLLAKEPYIDPFYVMARSYNF